VTPEQSADDVARLSARVQQLERENARLRRDTQSLWSKREHLWDKVERISGLGTWIWDLATDDVDWSPHLYEILGFDPAVSSTVAAKDFDNHVHEDDLEDFVADRERAMRGEAQAPTRFRFVRPDGGVVHLVMVTASVTTAAGEITAFVGSMLDITQEVSAGRERLRAGRLEAVGRLASGVAHDFNNLLMVVSGNAELQLARDPADEEAQQIVLATETGASLTRHLLSFARQSPAGPSTIDVSELTEQTVALVTRLMRENIEVRCALASSPSWGYIDAGQLQSAIINLAINARDAMPGGGVLTLGTRVETLRVGHSMFNAVGGHNDVVVVTVADTGMGMDEQTIAQIFDPFFTTKDGTAGTTGSGLGLASVVEFVEGARGGVNVDSTPGAGTCFELFFPRDSQHDTEDPPPKSDDEAEFGVLLVEETAVLQRVICSMLDDAGMAVHVADNAQDALALWPKIRGGVDALLTDVAPVPGMTGYDLAARLRDDKADLGIVFMAGTEAGARQVERAVILPKPFPHRDLIVALQSVLPTPAVQPRRTPTP